MEAGSEAIRVAVVTVSDRSFAGVRPDGTGPILRDALSSHGFEAALSVVPDDVPEITRAIEAAIAWGARAVITTGGTGIGPRDVTPEATAPLLHRALPGIPELLRNRDAHASPLVALSRGLAGVTGHANPAVVVNLAGSMSAVTSALEVLPGILHHAIAQLDETGVTDGSHH
jgi:molybdenum cofactor synthesis domain-containing protein